MSHLPTSRVTAKPPASNGQASSAFALQVPAEALEPIIRRVVEETLARVEADRANIDSSKLAYSEPEAAAMLGLRPHVLRDERRRGRIEASSIVGRRVRYQRTDLLRYLAERRTGE